MELHQNWLLSDENRVRRTMSSFIARGSGNAERLKCLMRWRMGDTGFVRRTKGRFVAPQFFRRNWGDTVSVRRNRGQGSGVRCQGWGLGLQALFLGAGCENQSNVGFLEHRGGGLVQQLATANLLEAIQQIFGLQARGAARRPPLVTIRRLRPPNRRSRSNQLR